MIVSCQKDHAFATGNGQLKEEASPVPVVVNCPHCAHPCQVADAHLGLPVKCSSCGQLLMARSSGMRQRPRLDVAASTSPGRVRKRNEDSFLVQQWAWSNLEERNDIALVVVADGMGGHDAGDRASGVTIRTLGACLAGLLGGALSGQLKPPTSHVLAETLNYALLEANREVHRQSQGDPACRGMGATAAAGLIWNGQALLGHVGDCRVYHHQGASRTCQQITRDHTLVARMVELGKLTEKEARNHPARNEVDRAIGRQPEVEPSRYQVSLAPGDWLIFACDGLHAHVDGFDLQEEFGKATGPAGGLAQHLVNLANQRGGSDNCTVVCVRCF
jgi:protein phosphatase